VVLILLDVSRGVVKEVPVSGIGCQVAALVLMRQTLTSSRL